MTSDQRWIQQVAPDNATPPASSVYFPQSLPVAELSFAEAAQLATEFLAEFSVLMSVLLEVSTAVRSQPHLELRIEQIDSAQQIAALASSAAERLREAPATVATITAEIRLLKAQGQRLLQEVVAGD